PTMGSRLGPSYLPGQPAALGPGQPDQALARRGSVQPERVADLHLRGAGSSCRPSRSATGGGTRYGCRVGISQPRHRVVRSAGTSMPSTSNAADPVAGHAWLSDTSGRGPGSSGPALARG